MAAATVELAATAAAVAGAATPTAAAKTVGHAVFASRLALKQAVAAELLNQVAARRAASVAAG